MIEVSAITYDYAATRALERVSLHIPRMAITALVGPHRAGKTTLMRCLAGLDVPAEGKIEIDGIDACAAPREIHARIGYVPDRFGLYDHLSVRRCLSYAALARGIKPVNVPVAVAKAASRADISERLEARAGELSRSFRLRLAIAQGIVHEPRVLLLDDPGTGLDPEARHALSHLLLSLKESGMTVVVSAHITAEVEEYCSSIYPMEAGHIVGSGALKLRDDERPRFVLEIATPRSDLGQFIAQQGGVDLIEADQHHALFIFTRNPGARARLIQDLIANGFDLSAFSEATATLERVYFPETSSPDVAAETRSPVARAPEATT